MNIKPFLILGQMGILILLIHLLSCDVKQKNPSGKTLEDGNATSIHVEDISDNTFVILFDNQRQDISVQTARAWINKQKGVIAISVYDFPLEPHRNPGEKSVTENFPNRCIFSFITVDDEKKFQPSEYVFDNQPSKSHRLTGLNYFVCLENECQSKIFKMSEQSKATAQLTSVSMELGSLISGWIQITDSEGNIVKGKFHAEIVSID